MICDTNKFLLVFFYILFEEGVEFCQGRTSEFCNKNKYV
jgi:hypothetical protein